MSTNKLEINLGSYLDKIDRLTTERDALRKALEEFFEADATGSFAHTSHAKAQMRAALSNDGKLSTIMKLKIKKPMTPQQAINNFKLFLELHPRNSYEDYRAAVCEIAQTCLDLGIEGDNEHPIASLAKRGLRR